jgi:putative transposase
VIKPSKTTKTLRLRLKDKHAAYFSAQACEVNMVWNFCNELSFKVFERERRFMSAYDIHPYTKGAAEAGLNLHSQTIQAVAEEFVVRRKQFKKVKLAWRCQQPKKFTPKLRLDTLQGISYSLS